MRYAIVSDVHGRRRKLQAVLADAQARGADQIVSLGDVGGDDCLADLRRAGAIAVFGNYEVSGWPRLAAEHQGWVRSWPPLLSRDGFLAVHAVPWWPEGLRTIEDFGAWLKSTGQSWQALFPYLTEDDGHLWQAVAALESADRAVLFHGHTHLQTVWQYTPSGRLRSLQPGALSVRDGHRYIVGVGSAGLPEDGAWAAYTLFDADTACIELVRLSRRWLSGLL
jgi:predicted phosphodiesterase